MRTEEEVIQFRDSLYDVYEDDDPSVDYFVLCWEACIPKTFWNVVSNDVTHNKQVFRKVVVPYRKRWKVALRNGYSLLFVGDNGAGKSLFTSYILTQMIKRGLSVYYTTLAQLDIDIKKSFRDKEFETRLEQMLESDFLAIDELGKAKFKADDYLSSRLEHLLKKRYDDGDPVLLASNISHDDLCKMYGSTFESMIEGKYRIISLEPGDFRKIAKSKMKKDMGYK